jgi:hypothetical protein
MILAGTALFSISGINQEDGCAGSVVVSARAALHGIVVGGKNRPFAL